MSHQKLLRQAIRITLMTVMLAGCVAPIAKPMADVPTATSFVETATPAPPTTIPASTPPTQPTTPKAGYWKGEIASFHVTPDGHIQDFRISIPFSVIGECVFTVQDIVIEADNTFVMTRLLRWKRS